MSITYVEINVPHLRVAAEQEWYDWVKLNGLHATKNILRQKALNRQPYINCGCSTQRLCYIAACALHGTSFHTKKSNQKYCKDLKLAQYLMQQMWRLTTRNVSYGNVNCVKTDSLTQRILCAIFTLCYSRWLNGMCERTVLHVIDWRTARTITASGSIEIVSLLLNDDQKSECIYDRNDTTNS